MSADTVTVSPTHRFGAYRPPSIVGWGRLMRIRLGGSELRGAGIPGVSIQDRPSMNLSSHRSSGVQLHPTSLPGGRLGAEAYGFVDWLAEAGQRWWQMLPLGPPDRYGSPYKSPSAFAAWPGLLEKPRARVSSAE